MEYRSRQSTFESEKKFLLEADCLIVESATGTVRVPFSAIREIRLRYQPNRYESDIYECGVDTAQGQWRIFSRYVAGVLDFRDQGPAYRLFVSELCLHCARSGSSARFCGGATAGRFLGMGLVTFSSMALLSAALSLPFPAGILVPLRLAVLAPMLLVTVLWFLKNRPIRFDPASIPDGLLPKG